MKLKGYHYGQDLTVKVHGDRLKLEFYDAGDAKLEETFGEIEFELREAVALKQAIEDYLQLVCTTAIKIEEVM